MRGSSRQGFTLFEILAVVALISIVFGVIGFTLTAGRARMSNASYQFTQDVQGLYAESIKSGRIHRLMMNEHSTGYTLDVFEMPRPRPKADDREGIEKWELEQKEIEESWKNKDIADLTRIDRGIFKNLKKRTLNSSLKMKHFVTARSLKDEKDPARYILFYPSGETEQALIVLEDSSEKLISMEVDPLSGRVKTVLGEVTLEQWKKDTGLAK